MTLALPTLLGDIGATNARFALLDHTGALHHFENLKCRDYSTFEDAIAAYYQFAGPGLQPNRAFLAIACPIHGDRVKMTNHHWEFQISNLKNHFNFAECMVMNDFRAVALSLPYLKTDQLLMLQDAPAETAPKIVVGPGTGLGVAALVPDAKGSWLPLATEGGHASLAANNEEEEKIIHILRKRFDHVSAERLLCGAGLVNIYTSLAEIQNRSAQNLRPEDILQKGLAPKDDEDALCEKTLHLFCEALGAFAGNLALSYGAFGGVYLTGSIVNALGDFVKTSNLKTRFLTKGRFENYLGAMPLAVIQEKDPAFLGLMNLAKQTA